VYSIAEQGAAHLLGLGEYFASPLDRQREERERREVLHWVELNEIQLRVRRAGLLVKWVPEAEIVSENEWPPSPYAKDDDALVTVRLDLGEVTFGLEYERSPKSEKRYAEIVEKMKQEQHVSQLLYLTATPTFFVNGRKIVGAPAGEEFRRLIAEELAKAQVNDRQRRPSNGDFAIGPDGAPVVITWFSDLQSPLMPEANRIVQQLVNRYPKQIRVVIKSIPLEIHKEAWLAHEAVLAAAAQGRAWEMLSSPW